MKINLLLDRLFTYFKVDTNTALASKLGISPTTLSNWKARNTIDWDLIFTKCEGIDANWLVYGGEVRAKHIEFSEERKKGELKSTGYTSIPLVSIAAIGGFGNADFLIKESDVKDFYVVPKFRDRRIDFMIEISGSSMHPKYNSGDVVACSIIKQSNFIQWNKVHVIGTTEQGILIKRLRKGSDPDHLLAVSDNKEYDPFEIPLKEIVGLAIVVGVIRLE